MDLATLYDMVLAEHPELAGPVDDWTVVTALREFAATHVDYVINVSSPYYVDQGGQAVEARFTVFEANAGGVVCGGAADALTELARAFGYSAWNLGIGDTSEGGFTHMQTLVSIDVDGTQMVTLHDPSTNLSYTDAAGQPIDYFDLLTALAGGDASGLGVVEDRSMADNLVSNAETSDVAALAESSWTVDPSDYSVAVTEGGWVVRSPRTLERFVRVIEPWYGPFLTSNGLPTDAIWLELFPHAIYGEGGDALLAEAVAIVDGSGSGIVGFEASEGFQLGDAGGAVNQRYTDAGYGVQTWYYGGITVVAQGDGQALKVDAVDGFGGQEEGIFELTEATDRVSLLVTSEDGSEIRVALKDTAYALIGEERVASGTVFAWEEPEERIWRVVVEAASAVNVDNFAYGAAADSPGADDTGPGDTGAEDTGDTDAVEDTDATGDTDAPGDTDATADVAATDATGTCGCTAGAPAAFSGWFAAMWLGLRRRGRTGA